MSPTPDAAQGARGTLDFYQALPAMTSFDDAADYRRYVEVPDDWSVVVTDVIGSTKAIEAGKYKNVNTVGVASIAAVSNVDRSVEIPFVFGGDGATFLVPNVLTAGVRTALLGARRLANDGFGLDLRLGIVPVASLRADGHWVRLAKVRMSPNIVQPAFSGRGWEVAEKWVKDPVHGPRFAIVAGPGEDGMDADFTGFECRWRPVKSVHGHKLAILVLAMSPDPDTNMQVYRETIDKIHAVYGEVEDFHPLRAQALKLSMAVRTVAAPEAVVRTFGQGAVKRWLYAIRGLVYNLIGIAAISRKIDTEAFKGATYRDEVVENSDFRKFDGMLRMVIDGNDAQADKFVAHLERERAKGLLVYGVHKSSEALVTCIVRSYNGNHTHFVDGSDGGYAIAARALKQQLSERKK
jgi:hypothetical protein